jgi:hypothetical protein
MADDIVKDAIERFKESEEGDDFNRKNYEDDVRFGRLGDQWKIDGRDFKAERQREGRPALTVNKLPSFIRQVVNDGRQSRPAINIHPVDNGADPHTADVIKGLVRSVERMSNADIAYDTALEHAVSGGVGYFRIGIDYAHDDSFDMECQIERVPNPLMVHRDINSTRFDASDWDYAFVSEWYSEDEYKQTFPDAEPVSFEGGSHGDDVANWLNGDRIRVAEYWRREMATRELLQLTNGQDIVVVREDLLPNTAREAAKAAGLDLSGMDDEALVREYMAVMGLEEKRRRTVNYHEVFRHMINGVDEVKEKEPWAGSMIPICPVYGDEVIVDGKRHLRSLVRDARDSQMMVNFWRSATTELVALAPKAPWIGPVGFVPEGDMKWSTANSQNHDYLEYDPTAGNPPQRQPFAGVPAGALQEALNASDDIKAIIGIYDSSLGARSNETSGKAINARQREADVSNFHFLDNLSRAIRYAGRVLVEIIPHVYSERQSIRILGEDQKEKVINLTQEDGGAVGEDGKPLLYNLAVGKYDVTVEAGPSYATQREETRETLIEIMRQIPGAAEVIGDIALRHMDFQGADEVAERLKALQASKMPQPPMGALPPPEAAPTPNGGGG